MYIYHGNIIPSKYFSELRIEKQDSIQDGYAKGINSSTSFKYLNRMFNTVDLSVLLCYQKEHQQLKLFLLQINLKG